MYSFKTCRHLMTNGRTCKSPAMRGSAYCYYHGPQKRTRRTSKPTDSEFEIDHLNDPSCVPMIGNQTLQAMAANRLSKGRASVMLQTLQIVMASYRMAFDEALSLGSSPDDFSPDDEPLDPPCRPQP
jgi:hypothetical protein